MSLLFQLLTQAGQTAVYWPPGAPDQFGKPTIGEPRELLCRWVNVAEEVIMPDGTTRSSPSSVYVGQDLLVGGLLMQTTLAVVQETGFPTDPRQAGAWEIKNFSKSPNVKGREVMRWANL